MSFLNMKNLISDKLVLVRRHSTDKLPGRKEIQENIQNMYVINVYIHVHVHMKYLYMKSLYNAADNELPFKRCYTFKYFF